MRIIAGEFRGRRLKTPSDYSIRPTSDKVKEAVFSIIMPYLSEKTVMMDVFSEIGYAEDLYAYYGFDSNGIVDKVREMMGLEFEEDESWEDE